MGVALFLVLSLLGGTVLFATATPVGFSADCDRLTGPMFFLMVGLVLGLIGGWVSYQAYKDGPNRDMRFIGPAVVFILVIFDTLGAGLFLNQLFDASPTTRYQGLAVAEKWVSSTTDGPDSYHVEMKAPPEDACSSTWTTSLPRDLFDGIKAGHTKLLVEVKPGAFGFPWVKKVSIVK
jgi:hypothetical protein